jgi:hypothetical protein
MQSTVSGPPWPAFRCDGTARAPGHQGPACKLRNRHFIAPSATANVFPQAFRGFERFEWQWNCRQLCAELANFAAPVQWTDRNECGTAERQLAHILFGSIWPRNFHLLVFVSWARLILRTPPFCVRAWKACMFVCSLGSPCEHEPVFRACASKKFANDYQPAVSCGRNGRQPLYSGTRAIQDSRAAAAGMPVLLRRVMTAPFPVYPHHILHV